MRDKKERDKYMIGCPALSRHEERCDVVVMRAKKGSRIRKLFEIPRKKVINQTACTVFIVST